MYFLFENARSMANLCWWCAPALFTTFGYSSQFSFALSAKSGNYWACVFKFPVPEWVLIFIWTYDFVMLETGHTVLIDAGFLFRCFVESYRTSYKPPTAPIRYYSSPISHERPNLSGSESHKIFIYKRLAALEWAPQFFCCWSHPQSNTPRIPRLTSCVRSGFSMSIW